MKGRIYSYRNTISKNGYHPVTVVGQGLHIAYVPKDVGKVTHTFQTHKNNQNSLWSQATFYSFNATNEISFDIYKT
jgi:CRISPR/Cas system-associated endonuclease Cas3-HD